MPVQRAAIYARYSTELQSEKSTADQIELCRAYCQKEGYRVVRTYHDDAISGGSVHGRSGLSDLLADAERGAFDVIVVEALDRLSRRMADLSSMYDHLRFLGIGLVEVHGGAANTLTVGLRGLIGQMYREDNVHKIKRGMTGVVRDGRHAGGRAYGYRPIPGRPGVMQIEEGEAAVVRRIFAEALDGRLPREIAAGLNRDGVLPPRGSSWNASTISGNATRGHGILRNPIYAGRIVWNRVRMIKDPNTGKRVSRPNPPEEWRESEAPHLAIIDPEDFTGAIAMLEARARRAKGGKSNRRPKRLLSGLLRCGKCGGGMSIHDRRGNAIRIRCTKSTESGICGNTRRYRLDRIEAAVVEGLKTQLAHPDLISEYVRVYREERRAEAAQAARERAGIERKIAELSGQIDRLMTALKRGTLPIEMIEEQIGPLNEEKKRLQEELDADPPEPTVELHPQAVTRYKDTVENLSARLQELDDKEDAELIAAFQALVDRVVVHDTADGGVEAEVIGYLSALMGRDAENWGGRVVAEEGFEPPTQGL